jgi:hypothetical protein
MLGFGVFGNYPARRNGDFGILKAEITVAEFPRDAKWRLRKVLKRAIVSNKPGRCRPSPRHSERQAGYCGDGRKQQSDENQSPQQVSH